MVGWRRPGRSGMGVSPGYGPGNATLLSRSFTYAPGRFGGRTSHRPARTNDTQEGSMTMHVLGRPGVGRRLATMFATVGAVAAVLAGMTAFALPAAAKTHWPTPKPTYTAR